MRHFDMEEWLDSVNGMVVKVTAPDRNTLGPVASQLMSSRVPNEDNDNYCSNCDDYVRLVKKEGEKVGHCPKCGKEPGLLELGTVRSSHK